MGDGYGNQKKAAEMREAAIKKISTMSAEEKQEIIDKVSTMPNEEAKKTLSVEEWIIATILCDRDSLKKLEKMPNSLIEELKRYIREKIKNDTLTFYDASILSHLNKAPWGPFELHEGTNKPKLN
ncbi:MAG: hypothetical protein IKE73_01405 [Bacilli bacterium]|nr:hypothetical protein [Bacilli bacterium]